MTALSRLLKAAAKRPWTAVIGDDVDSCAAYVDDVGDDNIFIATAYGSGYCTTAKLKSLLLKSRASTHFAVLAVNNFEALVSFLRDCAWSMGDKAICGTCFKSIRKCESMGGNIPCHGKRARARLFGIERDAAKLGGTNDVQ